MTSFFGSNGLSNVNGFEYFPILPDFSFSHWGYFLLLYLNSYRFRIVPRPRIVPASVHISSKFTRGDLDLEGEKYTPVMS